MAGTGGTTGGKRLVVVSNRVSVPSGRAGPAAGGLAVGILAALKERGGLWFGWSGEHCQEAAGAEPRSVVERDGIAYALLDLTREEHRGYYAGFSNRALWPLCHYRTDLASFEPEDYATYRRVNRRFAEALKPLLRPDDLVWVHDYHLIPLATELRDLGCGQRLGFFLHIPFPAAQVFATLPCHDELGRDLARYDVLGFHTRTDVRQFTDHQTRELGARLLGEGDTEAVLAAADGDRPFRAVACPIGVDVAEVASLSRSAEARRQAAGLKEGLRGRKLIVGVDRLDYTKGIPERLRAFEAMLRDRPEFAKERSVTFLQISAPSREEVPEYQSLRRSIERLAGHVNGRFGDHDWTPLRYVNKTYGRKALAGFFTLSSACLLTPLRDGLNLVAEEYVVVQDPADPGVLVLSRFAGATEVLDGALAVNPYDVHGTAARLALALAMPLAERQERHAALMTAIRANDITAWRRRFLAALDVDGDDDEAETAPPPARAAA